MADREISLKYTHLGDTISIGAEVSSGENNKEPLYDSVKYPVREVPFYGSRIVFRHSVTDKKDKMTVLGFKQSMPHESENKVSIPSGEVIDINYIREEKTQDEIVEKIRGSIPLTDMMKYTSFNVEFLAPIGEDAKSYALIKHRDFSRWK